MRLDGRDLTRLPLRGRKSLLRDALDFNDPLRFTPHRNQWDQQLLDTACARGWEGLIAKRADAPYSRRRSGDWLKLKCEGGQEFVIGGFTDPAGARVGFGALLLGYYKDGRLRYAERSAPDTTPAPWPTCAVVSRPPTGTSPFDGEIRERATHWVRPELVAQIGFTEWTRAGLLRHPRFLGLRDDKRPADVVREHPQGGGQ